MSLIDIEKGNDMSENQKIYNLHAVPESFTDDPDFKSGLKTRYLGALAGSEKIYVNIDSVKPGAKSVKYHSHSNQEEFFLVLHGRGSVRLQDKILSIKQGDFFAKPAGKGIAHQFINDGKEVLEILDCGTKNRNDVIEYPDEEVIVVKEKRMAFKGGVALKDWSSDPND